MKILKRIGIAIVAIIALLLIVALFIPKEYTITRSVVINKPKAEVFDFVKHIKNQDKYSVWNMADPNKKQTFTGTDGTVGFKNYWNGNDEVGEGEQEITAIKEGERLDVDIRFKRPFESNMKATTTTETLDANSTKVTSVCYGESSYPGNIMNPMMDGMIGNDLQQNLDNMKVYLEKQ
jgi:uncharacterized protein YndB with AHSA1/START domain